MAQLKLKQLLKQCDAQVRSNAEALTAFAQLLLPLQMHGFADECFSTWPSCRSTWDMIFLSSKSPWDQNSALVIASC